MKTEEVGKRLRQSEGGHVDSNEKVESSEKEAQQDPGAAKDEKSLASSAKKIRQDASKSDANGAGADALAIEKQMMTEPDWKTLYLKEMEKNKHLIQWILQLQSQLRNQMLDVCHPVASPAAHGQSGAWDVRPKSVEARAVQEEGHHDAANNETDSTSSTSASPTAKSEHPSQQKTEPAKAANVAATRLEKSPTPGIGAGLPQETSPAPKKHAELKIEGEGSPSDRSIGSVSLVHNLHYKDSDRGGMARTCCAGCSTGFAFCRSFLSQRDFLVLPCPNCHQAVAIPPHPGAPVHKPQGVPLLLELNWHLSAPSTPAAKAKAQHA